MSAHFSVGCYRKERRDGWDLRVDASRVADGWWREVRERMEADEDIIEVEFFGEAF